MSLTCGDSELSGSDIGTKGLTVNFAEDPEASLILGLSLRPRGALYTAHIHGPNEGLLTFRAQTNRMELRARLGLVSKRCSVLSDFVVTQRYNSALQVAGTFPGKL